jgi:hypothetical protein
MAYFRHKTAIYARTSPGQNAPWYCMLLLLLQHHCPLRQRRWRQQAGEQFDKITEVFF